MDVFGKGTAEPSRALLPPGYCWICEQSPIQEAEKVVDTRRNTRPGGAVSHESVRKYICEGCIRELGHAVGMVNPEEHAELEQDVKDKTFDLVAMHERLEAAEAGQVKVIPKRDVDEFLAQLKAELDELRAPVKKAARVPASDK